MDTSDGTIEASSVIAGKVGYSSGRRIVGTAGSVKKITSGSTYIPTGIVSREVTLPTGIEWDKAVLYFTTNSSESSPAKGRVTGALLQAIHLAGRIAFFVNQSPNNTITIRYEVVEYENIRSINRSDAPRLRNTSGSGMRVSLTTPLVDVNKCICIGSYITDCTIPTFGDATVYIADKTAIDLLGKQPQDIGRIGISK